MSDTTKVILAVLGAAAVIGIVVVIAKPSQPPPREDFTPTRDLSPPPDSGDAAIAGTVVRGVGGALHDVLGFVQADRDRAAARERDAADREDRRAQAAFCRNNPDARACGGPPTPDGRTGAITQHA